MNNNIKEKTSLVFVKGKNLINPSTLQNGSLNVDTGQYVSLQNAVVTDFIPIAPGDYVIKFFNTTNSPITYRMCYYDENKNLILGMNYENTSEYSFYISSSKYIRFCMAFASFSNLTVDDIVAAKPQLEQSSTPTAYEPYVEKQIHIKNKNDVFEKFYGENELNQENYSLNEMKIGTWIDGKPLYRKVYTSSNYATNYYVPTPNIKELVNVHCMLSRSDYPNMWQPVPSRLDNAGMSAQLGSITVANNTNINMVFGTNWSNSFNKIIFIVEYTKTTD